MAVLQYLTESRGTIQGAIDDPAFCRAIDEIAGAIATALADGRKLLLAGNGGSAADAQHIARTAKSQDLPLEQPLITVITADRGED